MYMSDILLLADIFENLRNVYLQIYKLDPAWYTSPGLIWDAMLKMTKIELELLSDYDMLLIIKKGIRGEFEHFNDLKSICESKKQIHG